MNMSAHEWQNLLEQIGNNLYLEESLDLSSQGLTGKDIPDLLSALEKNTSIRSLNLAFNYIGNCGAKLLAENETLRSLNVCGNFIDNEGAVAFLNHQTLTSLHFDMLVYLKMNFEEGPALREAARAALAHLSIPLDLANQIGPDEGVIALEAAPAVNQIGPELAETLAPATNHNPFDPFGFVALYLWNQILEGSAALWQRITTSLLGPSDFAQFLQSENQIDPELAAHQNLNLSANRISNKVLELINNQLSLNAKRIASENRFELFGFLCKKKIGFELNLNPIIFEMADATLPRPTEVKLKEQEEKVGQIQKSRLA
jgi:hypothetical protein